ncbi:chaplin [Streptomyces sp. DSM 40750]|nr:chaplin [Streptomyces sp. DSM 40750]
MLQVPVKVPINVCGNTVDLVGAMPVLWNNDEALDARRC